MICLIENPTVSSSNSEASSFIKRGESDVSQKISEKEHENIYSRLIALQRFLPENLIQLTIEENVL